MLSILIRQIIIIEFVDCYHSMSNCGETIVIVDTALRMLGIFKNEGEKEMTKKKKYTRSNLRPARVICIMHRGGRSLKWILVKDE